MALSADGDEVPPPIMEVAVVDHVRCHRDGLSSAIRHDPHFRLVAEAGRVGDLADEVVAALDGMLLQVGVAGVDLAPAVARVRGRAPACTVIVVVPWAQEDVVSWLTAAGADAVIASDAPLAEILTALQLGHGAPAAGFAALAAERAQTAAALLRITGSELEVLRRLSEGLPPQGIAHELHRSVNTIRDHIAAVHEKLGCTNAVELVVTAYRLGLLPGLGRPVDRTRR